MTTKVNPARLRSIASDLRAIASELSQSDGDLSSLTASAECKAGQIAQAAFTSFHTTAWNATARFPSPLIELASTLEKYARETERTQGEVKSKVEGLAASIPDIPVPTSGAPTVTI